MRLLTEQEINQISGAATDYTMIDSMIDTLYKGSPLPAFSTKLVVRYQDPTTNVFQKLFFYKVYKAAFGTQLANSFLLGVNA